MNSRGTPGTDPRTLFLASQAGRSGLSRGLGIRSVEARAGLPRQPLLSTSPSHPGPDDPGTICTWNDRAIASKSAISVMKIDPLRTEKDTMGTVRVPAARYWGAQTQRSLENFRIGEQRMPLEIIRALAIVKRCAAQTNQELGVLSLEKSELIMRACDEILAGELDGEFPLRVWQTGSGTQTNMNLNEVIANRGHVLSGGSLADNEKVLHPNDDVNKSQSSNDTFPTAMRIAGFTLVHQQTIPAVERLRLGLQELSQKFMGIIKIGRTHFMDATPLRLGDEFSAFEAQIAWGLSSLRSRTERLTELPIGGTAVGTGLNTPRGYDKVVTKKIADFTGTPYTSASNKFEGMASHDALVDAHASLKSLAVSLMKIANDIRMLSSGPRCGIGEISLPANEPGSSIMPGKVNPTQCEALTMVCGQVMGNDVALSIGGMSGHFQLNVFKPLIISNFVQSARLLAEGCQSFYKNCVAGITPQTENIQKNLNNSLMLVTSLNKHIGYEKAAQIAKKAYQEGSTLKDAALTLGLVTADAYDDWVDPKKMVD